MMAAARYVIGKLLSIRYEQIWFVCFTTDALKSSVHVVTKDEE